MRKLKGRIAFQLLALLLCLSALSVTASAAEAEVGVALPVTITERGPAPADASYAVVLTAIDGTNPMPEGSENGVFSMTVKGPGDYVFPVITFTRPGDYVYTIQQLPGRDPLCSYDRTVYYVLISVRNGENGLEVSVCVYTDDQLQGLKTDVTFVNRYESGGKEEPPEPPREPESPEEEETEQPEDRLPQTGQLNWPIPVLCVFGLLLTSLGLWLRRGDKKSGEDA